MIIIGAGMSGQLAAHYFRHLEPIILEKQDSLPNNHKALLRFRSGVVSDLTGIPFKKVTVQKLISFEGATITKPNLYLNNLYSHKVTGSIRSRSLGNLDDCERYIAPDDFISKLSVGLNIKFGQSILDFDEHLIGEPIISTMPVFSLAKSLGYKDLPTLKSREIWIVSFDLLADVDVYQTIYYPSVRHPFYRISITGKKLIAEFNDFDEKWDQQNILSELLQLLKADFGIVSAMSNVNVSHQKYGKLIECKTDAVKSFLGWATRKYNIYSLGRWGTHRQLLMDDVVKDIKKIDKMIKNNGYNI